MRYQQFLRELHSKNLFEWYLEIGTRNGKSLSSARGKVIAVDPFFRVERNVIMSKRQAFFFQMTSDAFFQLGFLEKNGIRLSLSFIDGMHLFEFLLRDFMNAEAHAADGGAIAIHDCCPYTTEMTSRDYRTIAKGAWTGDVWKIIPILRKYRPDLSVAIIGCRPTGLLMVGGLDPSNRVLRDNYDEIVREFADIAFSGEVAEEFYGSFDYEPATDFLKRSETLFARVCVPGEAFQAPAFVSP